jgi:hypothetical protein
MTCRGVKFGVGSMGTDRLDIIQWIGMEVMSRDEWRHLVSIFTELRLNMAQRKRALSPK